jgi:hypothetical protein
MDEANGARGGTAAHELAQALKAMIRAERAIRNLDSALAHAAEPRRPFRRAVKAWKIIALAAFLAAIPSTGAWASPVQRTAGIAAQLGAASTPAQAREHVAALDPSVKAALDAGQGAELLALAQSNPDIGGALAANATVTSPEVTNGRTPPKATPGHAARRRHGAVAHSAGCWGSWAQQANWYVGGVVAWVYVRENGWCGANGWITWLGGATFASWSWGPFCLGGKGHDYSWDGSYGWVHMAHWASLGYSYPWGCLTFSGNKAVIRIAWNGYADNYNDYGF